MRNGLTMLVTDSLWLVTLILIDVVILFWHWNKHTRHSARILYVARERQSCNLSTQPGLPNEMEVRVFRHAGRE